MEQKGIFSLEINDGLLQLSAVTDNIIRVVYTKKEKVLDSSALEIDKGVVDCAFSVADKDYCYELTTGKLVILVDKENGSLSFAKDGNTLLCQKAAALSEIPFYKYVNAGERANVRTEKTIDGERHFVDGLERIEAGKAYQAKMYFSFDEKEHIYGFGQAEDGIFDYRFHTQYLYQHNMRIPMPFFQSDKKYGILADCGCLMTFSEDKEAVLTLDSVEQLDYYFIAGDSADEVVKGFRFLTGKAAMLPKWAYGFVQSKEAYKSQQEILDIAKKYRALDLPIDCVVQDWNSWEPGTWGSKYIDKKRYPDVASMNKELHDMHVHSMISIWPTMSGNTYDYEQMKAIDGLLLDDMTYDAFSKEAREVYFKELNDELLSGGFDSWWCDSTEPFSGPDWNGEEKREEAVRFALVGEEHKKFLGQDRANLYAVYHAKGLYEHQKAMYPAKRVLNLTRSGYPGSQKYGTMLWSGDICATWDVFRKQIAEGLNMGLSGMPYWTFDVGGFFTVNENWQHRGCAANEDPTPKWFWKGDYEEGVDDYGYRELYVRWFQMGAFLPMFRSHGTDTPREIWNFGKPGEPFYDAIAKMMRFRYKLMPYIYSQAGRVVIKDDTMFRSLLFDFAEDDIAKTVSDEFMLGRNILVCPVTEPMYYEKNNVQIQTNLMKKCYLPAGCEWYDILTGEKFKGGSYIERKTPIDEFAAFVKAGSVIPMEAELSYADEVVETPLEFHIYPGADSSQIYYEDAGDGYGYENGEYLMYSVSWKDDKKKLTIEKLAGTVSETASEIKGSIRGRECVACMEGAKVLFRLQNDKAEVVFE